MPGKMRVRVAIAVVLLASCSEVVRPVVLDPRDGSVLSGSEALRALDQCSHYGPVDATATWVPTIEQIKELERRLPGFLRQQELRPPGGPRTYYHQYVGVVLAGRQLVYVNGFSKSSIADNEAWMEKFVREHPEAQLTAKELPEAMRTLDGWRSYAVVVCDGGSSYWGVLYDPETKQFSEYSANGIG
jgi:hypothetical protein